MRKYLLVLFMLISFTAVHAQLIVNEFSQGTGGTKEFFEFVVVGQKTCSDSTADLRGWIFDDNCGWYGSSGAAQGSKRFSNNANWAKVPYGSIILIYNDGDKNTNIAASDDPTDANHDFIYIVPVSSSYLEEHSQPGSGGSSTFVYPSSGYSSSGGWSPLGLNNSAGDAVIIVKPTNLATAYHSISYGSSSFTQTPVINVSQVGAGRNCYLQNSSYTSSSAYAIGNAGTSNETPGAPNTTANANWLMAMRTAAPIKDTMRVGICQGGSYVFNSTTYTTAGTYSANFTTSGGCDSTSTLVLTINPKPTVTVSVTDVLCYGASNGTATANPAGGTAPYSYSWNTSPVQTTATATNLATGSYTVTVTDSKTCTGTASGTIGQPTQLTAATSKTDATCNGSSNGTATVTASGGTAPYNYSWNTTPVQTAATASGLAAGTYTVTVTDAKNCTVAVMATVGQPSLLTASATKTDINCSGGATGTATVTASGGTLPYSYNWNTSPVQTTATATNLTAGTYTVTVTDAKSCMATASVTISQPSPLTATASKTNVNCFGDNTGTATVVAAGGNGPYTYSWNTTPVQTTATATNLAAGSYTVTVKDATNCTVTAPVSITQPSQKLTTTTTVMDVHCYGENNGTATAVVNGGTMPYTYNWNTVPAQSSSTATNLPAGAYKVFINDNNGCKDTGNVVIVQPAELLISPTVDKQPCPGLKDGAASITVSGGTPAYTILWNTTPAQNGLSVNNLGEGNYTVTVSDNNGCVKKSTIIISAFVVTPLVVNAEKTLVCNGGQVNIHATGMSKYTWSPPNGLSCPTCADVLATIYQKTTYTVFGEDANGCKDTGDVTINVLDRVPVSVDADISICSGYPAQLKASGGQFYSWSPGTGLSSSNIAAPVATPDSTIKYTVVITENECFKDTLYQTVTVYPRPSVDAGPDLKGVPGASLQLKAVTAGADRVQWIPPVYLSCEFCDDPVATVNKTITYQVIATSTAGCSDSDEVTITTTCEGAELYMANTFTPNSDGQNDRFYPQGKTIGFVKAFKVMNSWGQVVYQGTNVQANNPANGWDGTYKGETLSPDVFVYMVELGCADGSSTIVTGDVTLIR